MPRHSAVGEGVVVGADVVGVGVVDPKAALLPIKAIKQRAMDFGIFCFSCEGYKGQTDRFGLALLSVRMLTLLSSLITGQYQGVKIYPLRDQI